MKQESATRLAKGQVAQFIKYNEIKARKALRDMSCLVDELLMFEHVYEDDCWVKPYFFAVTRNSRDAQCLRKMRFSSA